ncbi:MULTISPECIES: hypothetical protein [unclassified Pseudoalteromonas]|uniref:hypothetical protein n=1 Tax=unclassified Pseudoalteromonas TaxID=194690 RepID=UPI001600203D|nr:MULTISPECIES: hypothetical protein [unclassified Pseudoalteromonas]MBB1333894.1 hypothetical protein [Pseudoalteromonas sp. SR41-6]MBB1459615.1 hypothetical protein [Pseudoalteromonas sp. SG41-8]
MSNNNDNSPATRGQFVTFEFIASIVFMVTVGISAWTWNNRVDNVDNRFTQLDQRFEKLDTKLDKLILSVNTIQNTVATKDDLLKLSNRVTQNEKDVARMDFRVNHIEKKTP